jgi:hypothetical protein
MHPEQEKYASAVKMPEPPLTEQVRTLRAQVEELSKVAEKTFDMLTARLAELERKVG